MAIDISAGLSRIIQQVFVAKVDYYRNDKSPTFQAIHQSARKVSMDAIGQNWQVIWPFRLGLGGSVDWGSIAGGNMATDLSASTPPGFQMYQDVETWAGLDENVAPAYVQRTVTLKKMKVNFLVPTQIIRAAQLGASIGDAVEFTIEGTAENVALAQCNAFLGQNGGASGGYPGLIGGWTQSGNTTLQAGSPVTITLTKGTAMRFAPGQRVDIFATGSNVRLNTQGPVFVDVNNVFDSAGNEGKIKLFIVNAGSIALVDTTVYEIMQRNSGREAATQRLPTSLDSLLKAADGSSNTIYGVNIDNYPIMSSLVRTSLSGNLDEPTLLKHLARYQHSRGSLFQLDTLVASEGVWAAFFQNMLTLPVQSGGVGYNSPVRFERNGAVMSVKGGVAEDVTFSIYGKTYSLKADPYVAPGIVYGLRLKNNFQYVRPPRIPGTKSYPGFDGQLEFLAPLYGGNGIFLPLNAVGGPNAGAMTNFLQAPAEMPLEIIPECVPGMKLGTFTEYYG